jgi:AbrB family transcriptional regulator, transcriptional pleiotropic regulator of transition state genes
MKATGVVRKLDQLGRIVIPIEVRRGLDLAREDPIEIFVEEDCIVLKKYLPSCIFCNDTQNVSAQKGKLVCKKCLTELKKAAGR